MVISEKEIRVYVWNKAQHLFFLCKVFANYINIFT